MRNCAARLKALGFDEALVNVARPAGRIEAAQAQARGL
jgi:hypothetical protein